MSIHVALNHVTHYRYDRPIQLGPQTVRLRPCPHSRTKILSYSLRVTPERHFTNWQQDPQANYLARLVFPEKVSELRVEVDLIAEMAVLNPFDFFLEPYAEQIPFAYEPEQAVELAPYLVRQPAEPLFEQYLAQIPRTPRPTIDFLVDLNGRLQRDIAYTVRMEPGVQTPEETLQRRLGSCRDSGWLLVQLLRHLGLAARFVSGYLIQLKADTKSLDGPSGTDHDFTDLHAWCEVYLPGAGWIGLDPTSGLLAGEGHIPLAATPEPMSAAPISGVIEPCESTFTHSMGVTRIWEAPRVTKPYGDAQWEQIVALGHRVDEHLQGQDVRLTMGGEPTFVSIDDPDGAEWNTTALGAAKRRLAAQLYQRMRAEYGHGSFVHFGQGKWYPGEPLPRWSLNCFWRTDGQPLWSSDEWLADETQPGTATADDAQRFLLEVARNMGLPQQHVFPAYEDAMHYVARESQLPVNVDPFDARVEDPLERAQLAKVYRQGLDTIVGYVFPVAKDEQKVWRSGAWYLRTPRCYLAPGNSAMGYRLPLNSQPWVDKADYPYLHPMDPSLSPVPLPGHRDLLAALPPASVSAGNAVGVSEAERAPAAGESAKWIVRTAMTAEPRDGRLYVFFPPTGSLDEYVELLAACEQACRTLKQPVIFEGYEPPPDPRIRNFRITPDPGVIEVNVQPSRTWDELVARTTFLYEQARLTRLSSEKFMIDGRHVGTGGGNHFVLGGATPDDSPFLRRPDLLRSLVSYWHNHPSLSYLFSGLFVGPTSQAPRVDEARNDMLHELEIAFQQIPAPGTTPIAPWLIDRVLRNLLVDVTGNTHRAEFCIDKLYSPDGPTGRLGLLELRAFEMPPHAQMSLVQQLLLRALIAHFWRHPHAPRRLARWGTELHDRFMLPHFIAQDFRDVIDDLRAAGYDFHPDWFAPHFEFRFPKYGEIHVHGLTLELRQALEPWHVMGEQGATGGTVRYVDSSVERVQVKLSGLAPDRYAVTCNGRTVPLQPTGAVGEYVAAVRYRAWKPAHALHPTIDVHAPLTFDVVDTWSGRAVGGCRYHVAHPGGRNFEAFPINAFEAESRRLARFQPFGHTGGTVEVRPAQRLPDFPFTLDLRFAD